MNDKTINTVALDSYETVIYEIVIIESVPKLVWEKNV